MKNQLSKIALIIGSSLITLVIIIIGVGYYLDISGKTLSDGRVDWTLRTNVTYDPRYIYWRKSWCQQQPNQCSYVEEQYVTDPIEIFDKGQISDQKTDDCTTILYLGDSFTNAPFSRLGQSYASAFSKAYSSEKQTCVIQQRLATGGVGPSQELARFEDVIDNLQPDLVIWQFYMNDIYDNVQSGVHTIENDTLSRKTGAQHFLFWAGFLNQKIPFLKHTTAGKHIMALGKQRDVFNSWTANPNFPQEMIDYNQELMPRLLQKMRQLASDHHFTFLTTLAPLECDYVDAIDCFAINEVNKPYQDLLEQMLRQHSDFVSMNQVDFHISNSLQSQTATTSSKSASPSTVLVLGDTTVGDLQQLFNTTNDSGGAGYRHFSELGDTYFGTNLFQNYLQTHE